MENAFENEPTVDNRTGRFFGFDVQIENHKTLVFTPNKDVWKPIVTDEIPPAKKEAFLDFAKLHDNALAAQKEKRHETLRDAFENELLEFAREHGPLFGNAGQVRSFGRNWTEEPICDWIAAQRTMELVLKAEVFSRGEIVDTEAFDSHFLVMRRYDENGMKWDYIFDSGYSITETYKAYLKQCLFQRYTTEDNTVHWCCWSDGGCDTNSYINSEGDLWLDKDLGLNNNMWASFTTEYPREFYPDLPTLEETNMLSLSKMKETKEIKNEVGSLLKIVADAHVGGMGFGFRNHYSACDTKDEGVYGFICSSYLSYMWHELAQAYSRNSFRVCANPKCEGIVSYNVDTSSGKKFCCDKCRSQANVRKLSDQEKRARRAFYKCLTFEEIYKEAFGCEYSPNDPDQEKLEARLDRWIAEHFSPTAKGQKALAQGAGKKKSHRDVHRRDALTPVTAVTDRRHPAPFA